MKNRFHSEKQAVLDHQTDLMWSMDASPGEFPMSWAESFDFIQNLNTEEYQNYNDWRLPNRRELFSLISHERINPALPAKHPFKNIFHGYYWSAGTCARLPGQAWYVHLGGARVYRGMKYASYMVWPVRSAGKQPHGVFFTGQHKCYNDRGNPIECDQDPLQHASIRAGIKWPKPRFSIDDETVTDRLTGLIWTSNASFSKAFVTWEQAGKIIRQMNIQKAFGFNNWRIPHIRELESLTDMGMHSPALPADHPFINIQHFYWSGTTSMYESRYAWTFYLQDGAVGVGFKSNPEFYLWPVCGESVLTKNFCLSKKGGANDT
jgi:hypothetical protein